MTVRLRAHHLLCLLTYVGKGYSPSFVANYDRIAERLSRGETIVIVEGPDDICAPLLNDPYPHCQRDNVAQRDRRAARDMAASLGLNVDDGSTVTLSDYLLIKMRKAFVWGKTRSACAGCEWNDLCSSVAAKEYPETRVGASDVP